MKPNYDEDIRELKHAVSGLAVIIKKLIEKQTPKTRLNESWNRVMKQFHEWRTRRFDMEVEAAERVLEKAGALGDYGASWANDKFHFNPDYRTAEKEDGK